MDLHRNANEQGHKLLLLTNASGQEVGLKNRDLFEQNLA